MFMVNGRAINQTVDFILSRNKQTNKTTNHKCLLFVCERKSKYLLYQLTKEISPHYLCHRKALEQYF